MTALDDSSIASGAADQPAPGDTNHERSGAGAPSLIGALVGICLCRLVLTGTYKRYVRVGMGPYLLAGGIVLIGAAAVVYMTARLAARRHTATETDHDNYDDHHDGVAIKWLLLIPVLTVFAVAPPSLGSFALSRALATTSVARGAGSFTSLPGPGPVTMLLKEFNERAFDRDGTSFASVPVTVIGFVGPPDSREGFLVARFQIACCAADGRADVARVVGYNGTVPRRDSWVQITGTFESGAAANEPPRLRATSLTPIPAPNDPYEPK